MGGDVDDGYSDQYDDEAETFEDWIKYDWIDVMSYHNNTMKVSLADHDGYTYMTRDEWERYLEHRRNL